MRAEPEPAAPEPDADDETERAELKREIDRLMAEPIAHTEEFRLRGQF